MWEWDLGGILYREGSMIKVGRGDLVLYVLGIGSRQGVLKIGLRERYEGFLSYDLIEIYLLICLVFINFQ